MCCCVHGTLLSVEILRCLILVISSISSYRLNGIWLQSQGCFRYRIKREHIGHKGLGAVSEEQVG